jgi:phage terminase large subunit-like protein
VPLSWTLNDPLPKNGFEERGPDEIYYYDADRGDAAVVWLEKYIHIPEGDDYGKRWTIPEWQAKIARARYGWCRRTDGGLRYTKIMQTAARGNAKTMEFSAFTVKGLAGDGLATPIIQYAGTDADNAAQSHRYSANMVRLSKPLLKRLRPLDSTYRIVRRNNTGFSRVLAADKKHAHIGHPSHLVEDDMQEMDREFHQIVKSSQSTVKNPTVFQAFTAGTDFDGIAYEIKTHGQAVLKDPELDPELLVVIYEAKENADFEDPAVMRQANPNLGVSVQERFLRDAIREAKGIPSQLNSVLTFNFNVWVRQKVRWLTDELWDTGGTRIDEAQLAGRDCYIGVDLATVDDVAAVAYVFPAPAPQPWTVMWDFFIPKDNLRQRVRKTKVPFDRWVQQGWVEATPGNVIDTEFIETRLLARVRKWKCKVRELAFDPWQAQDFAQRIAKQGVKTIEVGNTCAKMNLGVKTIELLALSKRIVHGAHPVARWMVQNTQIVINSAGEKKPDKKKSGEKIDGVTAMVLGVGRAAFVPEEQQRLGAV